MIYVLLLQNNKFYVGYSERPVGERFIEHFNYQGSKWTTLHRPVQVLEVKPGGIEEENEMTLRMMDKYGWWNVRGGSWCQVDIQTCPPALLDFQRLKLPTPLGRNQTLPASSNRNNRNVCSRCGRDSHSASNCFARTDADGEDLEHDHRQLPTPRRNDTLRGSSSRTIKYSCSRCGRDTHLARDCYARLDINGSSL